MRHSRNPVPCFTYCLHVAVVSLGLFGCGDDSSGKGVSDAGGPDSSVRDAGRLSCERASVLFAEFVAEQREGRQTCESDANCTSLEPNVTCSNGARIVDCRVAVAASALQELEMLVSDADSDVCKAAPAGCIGAPGCVGSGRAQCVSRRCELMAVEP